MTDDKSRRTIALVTTTLASFLTPFMSAAVNIALPSIGREFSLGAVSLGWIATSFLLAAAILLIPFGRLADLYGQKKFFIYGVLIFTLASLLSAIAPSSLALIAFRVLQGAGGAMIFSTGVAILTSVYPPGERGRVLGINVTAVYIGISIGPFLGGVLTQNLGWRSIFLVNVPLGLFILALTFWKFKGEWAEAKGETFDLGGSVVFSLTLIALMYGFTLLPGFSGAGLILASFLGMGIFIFLEKRTAHPVLDIRLFQRNRVFAFSNLAALVNYSATAGTGFLLSLYLQYIKGLRPQSAGLVLLAQPIVQAIFSPMMGRLSDRIEPQIVASVGMSLTAGGLFLLTFISPASTLLFIVGCLVLLGFGFAQFSSPNMNAIMSSVEKRFYGVASATLSTMRLIGQMLSMGIAMMILSLSIGRVQIAPDNYPLFMKSARMAFVVFAVLCAGGVFASLARGKKIAASSSSFSR